MLDLGFFTRSRVRLVRQTEIAECGLASLTMVACPSSEHLALMVA
jgi:ATP-binding cassette subfamily B protein RaxB